MKGKDYDHISIEKKWQKEWSKKKVFEAEDNSKKKKFYSLIEFPYPSGDGLHVGHPRPYIGMDVISRKKRMEGFNVLYPIGWDAFGLPTENYAIKTGKQPQLVTKENSDNFRRQIQLLGVSFDWSREINTTDPKYYKWTQWMFLKFLEHDMAYKAKIAINWCPKDKIGLANEEVINGCCERCGTPVEKREKEQWMLRITKYAERLDKDLDTVDYLPQIKLQQRNWIGKSEGVEIDFRIKHSKKLKYVLLHGFTGSPQKNFFPWLKKELEKDWVEVFIPTLPHTDDPKVLEQVEYVLKSFDFDENTVLVGHSLGGVVALKVLERLSKPIHKTVLVGSYIENNFLDDDNFEPEAFDWKFDALKIKNNAGSITILRDLKDDAVPQNNTEKLHKLIGGELVDCVSSKPHFCGKQEPIILKNIHDYIKVFTTRPDTIFGATYMVISPEHPLIENFKFEIKNWNEVQKYINEAKSKTEIQRTSEEKVKTGVELHGVNGINPATKKEIPIFVADYVLSTYGTGAIMAVPAHDERDFQFAFKHNLLIQEVIIPKLTDKYDPPKKGVKTVERKAIQAIVINPKDGKVLTLKWKKFPWTTFVTGGIEGNEDMIGAAKREIKEETGYKNVKYIKTLGGPVESHFYANHKDENRKAMFHGLVFTLINDEREEVSQEEKEIHEVHWTSWEDLDKDKNIKCSEYDIWKDRFFNPPHAFIDEGVLINSGQFSGKESKDVKKEITKFVGGEMVTKYKLRDWIFSRQRYWGEPIPVVFCDKDGIVPLPLKDLPLKLPKVDKYQPTDSGESPLASITKWVNTKCPKCGDQARRETDTMPNWAGSSWYFLRYADPENDKEFASMKNLKYWMPVDWYNGGMEHTTLHLLYSRFWNKFLFDIGLVSTSEPYRKRTSHGLILAKGGEKMSKSKGNVVNPDEIVKTYGADTLRMYEMFMGPFDQAIAWGEENIIGVRRFLERVWRLQEKIEDRKIENMDVLTLLHKTIQKVNNDIETMSFNTAVSSMMILLNEMEKQQSVSRKNFELFLKILSPFAPHISEEIWSSLGNKTLLALERWPEADQNKIKESEVTIIVQINGKVRGNFRVQFDTPEQEVIEATKALPVVKKWVKGTTIKKVVYVPNRLVNIVVL